jgi:hypothetical protein
MSEPIPLTSSKAFADGWQYVVESYPCPRCGANPMDQCRTRSGTRKAEPHASRSRQAEARGWLAADEDE